VKFEKETGMITYLFLESVQQMFRIEKERKNLFENDLTKV